MDFFTAFSLLLGVAFLVSAFMRHRIFDSAAYRKAFTFWLAALILYYPVSELFAIGVYLGFVARPVGFVLGLISFRFLWLGLGAPDRADKNGASSSPEQH